MIEKQPFKLSNFKFDASGKVLKSDAAIAAPEDFMIAGNKAVKINDGKYFTWGKQRRVDEFKLIEVTLEYKMQKRNSLTISHRSDCR